MATPKSEKLTDQRLRTLPVPERGRVTIWDTVVRRFGVRLAPGGGKTFVIRYRHRGRQERLTLGHYPALSLADARDLAKQKLAQVEQGHDPAAERRADREALAFDALASEYMERYARARRKRSWKADERHLRVDVLPVLGRRVAKDITRRDVRNLVEDIAKRAPVHANRVLVLIKKVLTVAVDRELIAANVAAGLARPTKETPRTKVLTHEEVRALVAALDTEPSDVQDYMRLRFYTATRGGEALSLRWADLDLDAKVWTVPADVSKTGKAHRVPLVDQALTILQSRRDRATAEYVFPSARPTRSRSGRRTGVQDAYKRLRSKSGVSFVGHDLRRWWASTAAGLGIPHEVIARALGHQVPGITARHYAVEGYEPAVRHAMERVAAHLERILTGETAPKVVPLRSA